jgi:hypothetical protein
MALVLADRVRDTTTTTGTGTVTLSGTAPTGYQNFSVIGNGNTCYYTINGGSQWEVGIGTYSSTGPTLARTTVLASSSSGSAVDFAAGTKDVFVTYPAEKSVNYDASDNVGIGNTNPGFKLEVTGDVRLGSGGGLRLGSATGTTGSSGDSSIFSDANDMNFSVGSNIRMYIANGGNVGIGNTGPGYRLDVASADTTAGLGYAVRIRGNATAAGGALQFTDSGVTAQWGFLAATATAVTLDATNASILAFRTNGSERMRITSGGDVGIGTTTPTFRLVAANNNFDGVGLGSSSTYSFVTLGGYFSSTAGAAQVGYERSTGAFVFGNGTRDVPTERMRIDSSGNVGIATGSPGFKLDVSGDAHTSGSVFTGSNTDGWGRFVNSGGALYFQAGSLNSGGATAQPFVFTNMYGGSERMRLDSNGKLLLGTSSATDGAAFQINAATAGDGVYVTRFDNTSTSTSAYNVSRWLQGASGSSVGYIGTGGSTVGAAFFQNRFVVGTQNNTALCFATNDTFRGMIDGGGQFWWGSQSTIDTVSYAPFQITNALAINTNTTSDTSAVSFFNGQGSGTRVGYIGTSGSSTSYNTSSDERLKENIANAADAGALIDAIQVRQFDWKINGNHQRYGMIAQELDLVFPEAVGHGPTEADMLAVDYSKLVPMLIKEIQSLRARVAQLEGK